MGVGCLRELIGSCLGARSVKAGSSRIILVSTLSQTASMSVCVLDLF